MDTKITLSFDASVIEKAKEFAEAQGISLSRLTEFFYKQVTAKNYASLYEIPIADWVSQVSEGKAEYVTKRKTNKELKNEFYAKK
jgi:antitoxin component of RelBE/YafQ-DinJ toxin-antitoxin module